MKNNSKEWLFWLASILQLKRESSHRLKKRKRDLWINFTYKDLKKEYLKTELLNRLRLCSLDKLFRLMSLLETKFILRLKLKMTKVISMERLLLLSYLLKKMLRKFSLKLESPLISSNFSIRFSSSKTLSSNNLSTRLLESNLLRLENSS